MAKNDYVTRAILEEVLDQKLEEKLEDKFEKKFTEKIDPLYILLNQVLKEIQDFREESTILRGDHDRVLTLEDEMDVIKNIHPGNTHVQVSP